MTARTALCCKRMPPVWFSNENTTPFIDNTADVADAKAGDHGDANHQLPVGPPYANEMIYVKELAAALVLGVMLGACGCAFMNVTKYVPSLWVGEKYLEDPATVGLGAGEWWWVGITAGAGLLVGLLKVIVDFPDPTPNFFTEVCTRHVEPADAPKMLLVSTVSLSAGVSLGPESALGCFGGGMGMRWSQRRHFGKAQTEQNVLEGMSAAMGALFPSPILGVMLMSELGQRVDDAHDFRSGYMRSISLATAAAGASFMVYYTLLDSTYLERIETSALGAVVVEEAWKFEIMDMPKAALIGVVGGFGGFVVMVCQGVGKKIFARITARLLNRFGKKASVIVPPVIGGVLFGLIAKACPLVIGSGEEQLMPVMKGALQEHPEYGPKELLINCVFKALAVGVCSGSGFIGGQLFPFIFIGCAIGMAAEQVVDELNWLMSASCFMVAVPMAICPLPFTFTCMITFLLGLHAYQTAPMLLAAVVSHMLVSGSGLTYRLVHGKGHS